MQQAHKTYAGTSTVCTGVASRIPGTVVHEMTRVRDAREQDVVRIGHPAGVIETETRVEAGADGFLVRRATLGRTARRILEGYVFVPDGRPNAPERAWPDRSDAVEEPHHHGADGHQLRDHRRVCDRSGQAVLRGARPRRRGDDRHRGDEHLARRAQSQQFAVRVPRRVHSRIERDGRGDQGARRLHGRAAESPRPAAAPLGAGDGAGRPHRRHQPGDRRAGARASDRTRFAASSAISSTSARRLRTAGYDAVEIHAANGYLFHQFFTRRFNRRTDAYGGSVENRMRFLIETVDLIRDRAGRLSGAGPRQRDGIRRRMATRRTRSSRSSRRSSAPVSRRSTCRAVRTRRPFLSRFCIQPPSFPRRCLEPYARPLKSRAADTGDHRRPDHHTRGCRGDPAGGERRLHLAGTRADCRPALVSEGVRTRSTRRSGPASRATSASSGCRSNVTWPACRIRWSARNSRAWRRSSHSWSRAGLGPRKRVLVVGAGVSGVEAARVAAARGHVVEVWEKEARRRRADAAGGGGAGQS